MGLIKTILIFLLIFFGLRIIWRMAKPFILSYITKKAGEKFQRMAGEFKEQARSSKNTSEGQTTILHKPSNGHQSKKNVGEYIDYEEID